MKQEVRLGVIGVGNVGAALINLVHERAETITQRTGITLVVSRASVRDLSRARGVSLDAKAFTANPLDVVNDSNVDVVVELMGGIEPARDLITQALGKGKPVVTANKALLAEHGAELFAAADAAGVDLLFEAAVAGGIPSSVARKFAWRTDTPCHGHCEWHHKLYFDEDDRRGCRLRSSSC